MPYSPEAFAKFVRSLDGEVQRADPRQVHLDVGDAFREAQAENFQRAENEHGVAWPPRKHKYPHPILRKTRKMLGAASVWGAPGNIHRSIGGRLTLGISRTGVHYARYHQYGTSRLPVRQFFYLRRSDKPELRKPIRSHLHRVLHSTKGRYRDR
jgi:phage gpG-like protein